MSKGSGSQTQTTKSEPWEGQAPYLRDIFSQAQNLTPQTFYPNQTYAEPSDTLIQAEQLGTQQALGGQTDIANALVPGFTSLMQDPSARFANPMFQNALRAGLNPIEESTQRLISQATQDLVETGNLGSTRGDVLKRNILKDMLTKQSDVASKLYGDVYGDALKSQAVAMQNIPTIMSGLQAPAQSLQDIGNIRTLRAQLPIDEAMQRYSFNQNANLANLQNYANLIGSPIPGTQTTTQPGARSNPLLGLLGAAGGFMIGGPSGAAAGFGIGNQL